MVVFSRRNRNILAFALVLLVVILVYGGTYALSGTVNDEPDECNQTFFSIEDICYNPEKQAYYGNQPTVEITIKNRQTDINGFKMNLFGDVKIEPLTMFKTVKKDALHIISAPYNKDIMGKLKRIEIKPILNVNQQIFYCSIEHGAVIEDAIKVC